MNNNPEVLIAKKMIQKELINELCSKNLIDITNTSNIVKKLDEDISKLKELQVEDKEAKNIIIKIPI